jgi:hypothetical protein
MENKKLMGCPESSSILGEKYSQESDYEDF